MHPIARNVVLTLVGGVVVIAAAAACSSEGGEAPIVDPPPVRTPTAMAIAYGNDQIGVTGSQLPLPIAVTVTDESGRPLQGVPVSFAAKSGGGSVDTPVDVTGAGGVAKAAWTPGSGPGSGLQQATARIGGTSIEAIAFTARAAAQLIRDAGDGQTGPIGVTVAEAPSVIILDADDQPVAGMAVDWKVTSGGGLVPSPTSLTDVNGIASMPW
jgi:hypothetical protein